MLVLRMLVLLLLVLLLMLSASAVHLVLPRPCFITPVGGAEQSMLRSARVASARPPAPSCPRSARALGSRPFASSHAAHAPGDRGARTAAAQQELHCERRTAPAHTKRTLTRPSATPPCASHGLGASASAGLEAAVSPQRAAPCAPHQLHKTSRDNTPHLCRRCITQASNGRRMA